MSLAINLLGRKTGVINLKKKQEIIKLHLQDVSQRKIAKETKVSRNTVRKYIANFEDSRSKDVSDLPIPEEALKKPSYKKRKGKRTALTDIIKRKIRSYIKENQWKKDHYMSKQQMKIIDMHEKLLDEGHKISYTTVRNFVNSELSKEKEVFIRKHSVAGYEAEFDWGEIKLDIEGKLKVYYLAIFVLPYSNYRFARIYESQSMVCLQDVHVEFINHINFIPKVFTYDNMRTVVRQFIGSERKLTDGMIHLSNYYDFKIRLCQPRKGNEKGSVERSVDFIRRKAFSTFYHFKNIEEANIHLKSVLLKLNNRKHHEHKIEHRKLLIKEEKLARPAVTPFDPSELTEARVTKYSTVVIKQNHYSVPEGYVGQFIKVKVGAREIKVFIEGELMAVHERSWGVHEWIMDINHYLKTFEKKKGALAQSECLRQAPTQIKNIYNVYYIGKEKEFLELLLYIKEKKNISKVMKAIKQLEKVRLDYVSTEKILFICERSNSERSYNIDTEVDDIASQSESNILAYATLFNQIEGVR